MTTTLQSMSSPLSLESKKSHQEEVSELKKEVCALKSSSASSCLPSEVFDKWNEVLLEENVLANSMCSSLAHFSHLTKQLCQLFHLLQENGRWLRRVCDSDFPLNIQSTQQLAKKDNLHTGQGKRNTSSSQKAPRGASILTFEQVLSSWIVCLQKVMQHQFAYETYSTWDLIMACMEKSAWDIWFQTDDSIGINYALGEENASMRDSSAAKKSILTALDTLQRIAIQLDESSLSDTKKTYALIAKSLRAQLLHDLFYALIHSQLTRKFYFKDALMRMEESSEQLLCLIASMSMFPLPISTERLRRHSNEVLSDDEI